MTLDEGALAKAEDALLYEDNPYLSAQFPHSRSLARWSAERAITAYLAATAPHQGVERLREERDELLAMLVVHRLPTPPAPPSVLDDPETENA